MTGSWTGAASSACATSSTTTTSPTRTRSLIKKIDYYDEPDIELEPNFYWHDYEQNTLLKLMSMDVFTGLNGGPYSLVKLNPIRLLIDLRGR